MKKRIMAVLMCVIMMFSLAACGSDKDSAETEQAATEEMTFEELVKAAKGTTVTFYGWGGD